MTRIAARVWVGLLVVAVLLTPVVFAQVGSRANGGGGGLRFESTVTLGVVLHLVALLAGLFGLYTRLKDHLSTMNRELVERLTAVEVQLHTLWREYTRSQDREPREE